MWVETSQVSCSEEFEKCCLNIFNIRAGEKCIEMCVSVFEMLKRLLKIGYQTSPELVEI